MQLGISIIFPESLRLVQRNPKRILLLLFSTSICQKSFEYEVWVIIAIRHVHTIIVGIEKRSSFKRSDQSRQMERGRELQLYCVQSQPLPAFWALYLALVLS